MIRATVTVAATTLLIARPSLIKAMATTTNSKLPTLKGVVFDMDDTLVKANLDIGAMYKEVFGRDPPEGYDILKEVNAIENPDEKARAFQIIEDIEEESRQQMTLMPGCPEVLTWLSHHSIPKALVTRNSETTTKAFCEKLASLPMGLSFERAITRDDSKGDEKSNPIPPKPDPTAMNLLAEQCFECETSEILMVGDSIPNDVAFGKNAGTQTALLLDSESSSDDAPADICVHHLTELPKNLWKSFSIDGPLGNTPEANQRPLHGSPPPEPQSELCLAVVDGNTEAVCALLNDMSIEDMTKPDKDNGNTALIWACEKGNVEIASLILSTIATKLKEDTVEAREKTLSSYVNHRGFLGATALNRAARRGHTSVLELLLGGGSVPANLFDKDLPNAKLQYPLHFAAFKKNPDALRYLLEKGANPWVLDRKGRTPLEDTSCETCKTLLREAMK